jgi:hypothetical protein
MNNVTVWPHDVPDGEWADLRRMSVGKKLHWVNTQNGSCTFTAVRTPRTVKGENGEERSGVLLRIDVAGGPTIVLETTLALFQGISAAFAGGEMFDADQKKQPKH